MILTARDLIHRLADDVGVPYREIAKRVNSEMQKGSGLIESVRLIARQNNRDPSEYRLDASRIAQEIRSVLMLDYSQTLMISAVLGQMVESKSRDRFPVPAFFAFLELLGEVSKLSATRKSDAAVQVDENTTRIIELTTTLVSVICEWSKEGIVGVSSDCPKNLQELARAVSRRTRMYQQGIWTCLSCGKMVALKDTRALLCQDCDERMYGRVPAVDQPPRERERTGYGQSTKRNSL